MTLDEAVITFYAALNDTNLDAEVTDLQELVFRCCWQGQTYSEIAEELGYDSDYTRQIGSQVWQLLSKATHQKVTKSNFKSILQRRQRQQRGDSGGAVAQGDDPTVDWGEAVDVASFYGRTEELLQLQQWILADNCRLITLLGMGGMGKTTLSIQLARQIQEEFDYVLWKSVRNVPELEDVLDYLIKFLSQQRDTSFPEALTDKISLLIKYLRSARCLVVLDNFESLLQSGEGRKDINVRSGQLQEGYEAYEEFLKRIGEESHASCFVLTSREQPQVLNAIAGEKLPVRLFKLGGLKAAEGREIFQLKGEFTGSGKEWQDIIRYYAGNPLALKMIVPIVQDYFGGSLTQFVTFLEEKTLLFHDIQDILVQQFDRLSECERGLMYWLAISQEPVNLPTMEEELRLLDYQAELVDLMRSLDRRSLVEKSSHGFTLQPVVAEYMIQRFLEEIEAEIATESLQRLHLHPLMRATTKDYVKASQIRLVIIPLVKRLRRRYQNPEKKLQRILGQLRQNAIKKGYCAGNMLNLLVHLGVDLAGYDFSDLTVWQGDLQNVNLHQVDFTGADLTDSVFLETFGSLLCVAYSPTGELLATGDFNREIRIYDSHNGQQLQRLQGHQDKVQTIAFSPDGTKLASGSRDQTIRIWEVATGECLQILRGHKNLIFKVTFDPTGTKLASGGDDQTARIWEVATGECQQVFREDASSVRSVQFDETGTVLFTAGSNWTIRGWDLRTGKCWQTLRGHRQAVESLAYLRASQTLVSASSDWTIKQWDLQTGECLQTLVGHHHPLYALGVSPDQSYVASAGADATIKIWDLATGRCLKTLVGHRSRIFDLAWSPDGKYIASAGQDRLLGVWEVATGECVKMTRGYISSVWSLAFHPAGKTLVNGSDDGSVSFWNLETGKRQQVIPAHLLYVHSVVFNPSGEYLATSSPDGTVKVWHGQTGQLLYRLDCQISLNHPLAFHPADHFLVSNEGDNLLRLSDVPTGQVLRRLAGHKTTVGAIALSQDGKLMASGSIDGQVILWDLSSFEPLGSLEAHQGWISQSAFHPHHPLLATAGRDGCVKLWDAHTGECLQVLAAFPKGDIAIAFYPDGTKLAIGSLKGTIEVWDLQRQQFVQTLPGHRQGISSLALAPQGHCLASSSMEGTVKLWDLATGRLRDTLRPPRPYEQMKITHVTGLSPGAIASLRALGAVL